MSTQTIHLIRRFAIGLARLWLFLILLNVCFEALAFQSKVIGIMDGDTIEVLKDGRPLRVRLHGIDCPERNQDFGSVARQFTGDKTFGRVVEIVPTDTDKYGRTVAKVYVAGDYLNLMLVAEGLAWWFKKYAPNDDDLAKAEQEARKLKKGLWSHPNPMPPWDFRRRTKSQKFDEGAYLEVLSKVYGSMDVIDDSELTLFKTTTQKHIHADLHSRVC